jgi:hypothetical protein
MPAGYSKRSLIDKLGIKEGTKIAILNPPSDYNATLGPLPATVVAVKKLQAGMEFIHFFVKEQRELETKFPSLKQVLAKNGTLWISWPKRASKVETDLDENIVREIGLRNGLVDIKVCAVDEIWSGLKFVYRLTDRV